jgi:hypothetical protein
MFSGNAGKGAALDKDTISWNSLLRLSFILKEKRQLTFLDLRGSTVNIKNFCSSRLNIPAQLCTLATAV